MTQGMSEEEVKKKLYGEFSGPAKKRDNAVPKIIAKQKAISRRPLRNFLSIKAVSIGIALLILLTIIIVIATKPKAKIEPSKAAEIADVRGYLVQGKKYYNDGLFDEAILTWQNIIAIDSDHRAALRYIKRAELKKKELKIQEEETAQKLKEMLAKREKEEGEKIIQKEVKRLLKEGDDYYRKKDFPGAVAIYEKVLRLSPGNYRVVKKIAQAEKKIARIETIKQKAASASPLLQDVIGTKRLRPESIEGLSRSEQAPPPRVAAPVGGKGPVYTVQIATYVVGTHAEELVKKLVSQGYKKLNIKKKVSARSNKTLYEVHLGPFDNKKEAEEEMKKIKKEGFKDSLLYQEK